MERVNLPLTDAQAAIAARVIAQEESRRRHVVVYLSGAHAYGFPSPNSDLDLKAIHVADSLDLLGWEPPPAAFDRMEIIDGVEIDYTSNELAPALLGILAGNGNYVERVLGRTVVFASSLLEELAPLVRRSLSRRVHRHYRGFALNQLRFAEKEPTAKKLLYVLRTALTGIHLLETGALETHLGRLAREYGLPDAEWLIARKRAGERTPLAPAELEAWRTRVDALLARLDAARETSPLPDAPPNEAEIRDWLLRVRRSSLR